jgi:hypothetical protein
VSQLWRHVAATQGSSTVKMALDNTDMLLVHLLLGAEAFMLVQIANLPTANDTDSRSGEKRHYRWRHLVLTEDQRVTTKTYLFVLGAGKIQQLFPVNYPLKHIMCRP